MRTEVHVHGSIFLCKGVRLKQVEQALAPWLGYLDVETLADAHSLEREEPGLVFDPRERTLNICWTGEVGRNFQDKLSGAFQNIGPLTEYASEVEVTYYPDHGDEEYFQVFVGPTPEAIHEFRRQCVIEDATNLLSRHLGKAEVDQVATLISNLFEKVEPQKPAAAEHSGSSTVIPLHPRGKHLH
ncbi:MAG: hypothetical protein FJY56_17035 [Betaproteobacteria bacterium]|nr:hypothetical protein [Betaproteobacteria bacterium]